MKHFLILIFFFCFLYVQSQVYKTDNIKNEYSNIFTARVKHDEGKAFVTTEINKLPENNFFADFINNNELYIDYILINYSSIDRKKLKSLTADTIELNNFFLNSLRVDSIFNKYFIEATHYFLLSVGKEIPDHKIHSKIKITADSLMAIATHFFYAAALQENGDAHWYVCVGKNGYHNNKKDNMIPLVEAFCFNAIMDDMLTDVYQVHSDFIENIKEIQKLKTDKVGEKKLDLYRQKMYEMMSKSEKLRKLLMDNYNRKKDILNFEIL